MSECPPSPCSLKLLLGTSCGRDRLVLVWVRALCHVHLNWVLRLCHGRRPGAFPCFQASLFFLAPLDEWRRRRRKRLTWRPGRRRACRGVATLMRAQLAAAPSRRRRRLASWRGAAGGGWRVGGASSLRMRMGWRRRRKRKRRRRTRRRRMTKRPSCRVSVFLRLFSISSSPPPSSWHASPPFSCPESPC